MKIQEMRFIADYKGTLRKICKLKFSQRDHSLYLIPYAPGGEYFYGQQKFPQHETSHTFNFVEGAIRAEEEPHLSLHESGRVQVYSGQLEKAGPLFIPTLTTLPGRHIASVIPDAFESLPVLEGSLRTGVRWDHVIHVEPGLESGRLAFFISNQPGIYSGDPYTLVIPQRRPTYQGTVYIAVINSAQSPLGIEKQIGTTVLTGWNPDLPPDQAEYLYVRGR